MIEKLVEFARKTHSGFEGWSDEAVRRLFLVYQDTTLVRLTGGEVTGFLIYQDWQDRVIALSIACVGSREENMRWMFNCLRFFDKPVMYYDNKRKRPIWVS